MGGGGAGFAGAAVDVGDSRRLAPPVLVSIARRHEHDGLSGTPPITGQDPRGDSGEWRQTGPRRLAAAPGEDD